MSFELKVKIKKPYKIRVCGLHFYDETDVSNQKGDKVMEELQLNTNGVNAKIKANILEEGIMRKIDFTDYNNKCWYFCRPILFPKERRYKNFDVTFNVSIPKDGSDISIDILDEDFCQPYDYQKFLKDDPSFNTATIVKEQVEKWMMYLQDCGVLRGHVYGEYI